MKKYPALLALLAFAVCGLWTGQASAITSCSISSVVGVAFGGYDPTWGSPLDSAGSVTFSCAGVGASDTVLIQLGRGSSSTFFPRTLLSGGSPLAYNLFLDAARSAVWGDGTGGTSSYGPVTPPEGTNTTVNIFGRIPAGQNVPVGSYSDTLLITLLY